MSHACKGGLESSNYSWWEYDAQGIPLCRVCEDCETEKLSRYRPEILSGYTQADVDEPIRGQRMSNPAQFAGPWFVLDRGKPVESHETEGEAIKACGILNDHAKANGHSNIYTVKERR